MNVFQDRMKRIATVALLVATSAGMMGLAPRPPAPNTTTTTTSSRPAPAIPEPAGFVAFALGAGIVGLALHRRSRRK